METIGIHFSVFITQKEKSFIYVYSAVKQMKLYIENKLYNKNIFYIFHVDDTAYLMITELSSYENVDITKFKFIKHNQINDYRGICWRYYAILDTNYDITAVGEVNDSIRIFNIAILNSIFTLQKNKYRTCFFVLWNKFNSYRMFGGKENAYRPNLILNDDRNKIKKILDDYCNSTIKITYGFDEDVLLKKIYFDILKSYPMIMHIIQIEDHIPINQLVNNMICYKKYFKNSLFDIREWAIDNPYDFKNDVKMKCEKEKQVIQFNNKQYSLNELNHIK